ncbi:hypothetical protein TCAL_09304 [Tigriopus californicus]|uniref:Delta(24)-sterol reductase n=1 Tax=Tigriopus californicus TaxID=6832 RepID=A0A553PM28_TIGCA|nr:delta(24)-sterol reductase-like [Tigriopus californicus]TRY78727.1 hypothetical protein TCAL_09304 [Tigriopus californicus]|eukprot:TCALIF_09304-PA protein Name:"Similar to DHCR24 Delta(24)-sterol reductase (Macaca fascicularis)" AED:0.00 eAED:0.00 QI:133/1/1/1/1/1/2/280/505
MSLHGMLSWLVVKCPWIPVLFLIPCCIIYDTIAFIRFRWASIFHSRDTRRHEERVQHVQEQVREWKKSGSTATMCTARPGYQSITLQTLKYKKSCQKIEINMPDIISIDTEKKTVRVEPMVTIGQLNDYLIGRGWTLPVVPELDDLTIGGLVMGGGIESTSHKYGLFQYICRMYEMVLADGSVVQCSRDHMTDLWVAIPFSYGTLGFLTAVDLDIIPFKKYIKLTYIPVEGLDNVVEVLEKETRDPANDSVEGILYSLNEAVIMTGVFTDECENWRLNKIGRWFKPLFHAHVKQFLKPEDTIPKVEYIPTLHFFHRHDKSCFWLVDYIVPFINHWIFRWFFGWTMPPKHAMIKILKEKFVPPNMLNQFVCQDLAVQFKHLKGLAELSDEMTKVYPIWLCPCNHLLTPEQEKFSMFKWNDLNVDFGVYGFTGVKSYHPVEGQKRFEKYMIDNEGFPALYAETQFTEEEFRQMVNLDTYERLRRELNCEGAFPHLYEKVSKLGRTSI